jgi:hypothetical protein
MSGATRALGGEAQSREAYLLGLDPNLNISSDFTTPNISVNGENTSVGYVDQNGNPVTSGGYGQGNQQQSSSGFFGPTTSGGSSGGGTTSTGGNVAGGTATAQGVNPVTGITNAQSSATAASGGSNPNAIYGGSGYGSFANPYNPATFYQDPGYQFIQQQGQQFIQNQQATTGMALSPAALAAGLNYTTGLASQEFNNAYNRSMNTQTTQLNELNALASGGQVATSTVGNQLGSAGAAGSSAIGNYGNATSAGIIGQSNAQAGMVNGIANGIGSAFAGYSAYGSGGGNPYNLGGSTPVAAAGYQIVNGPNGITTVPISSTGGQTSGGSFDGS